MYQFTFEIKLNNDFFFIIFFYSLIHYVVRYFTLLYTRKTDRIHRVVSNDIKFSNFRQITQ